MNYLNQSKEIEIIVPGAYFSYLPNQSVYVVTTNALAWKGEFAVHETISFDDFSSWHLTYTISHLPTMRVVIQENELERAEEVCRRLHDIRLSDYMTLPSFPTFDRNNIIEDRPMQKERGGEIVEYGRVVGYLIDKDNFLKLKEWFDMVEEPEVKRFINQVSRICKEWIDENVEKAFGQLERQ